MSFLTNAEVIRIAVESVRQRDDLPQRKKEAVVAKLEKFEDREWFQEWTKEGIIEALQDFKIRTGRAPNVSDLKNVGMPKSLTIKRNFGMDASAFLRTQFPELCHLPRCNPRYSNPYGLQTKEDWINCFKEQFEKHGDEIDSAKKYNAVKDPDTPTWNTICAHTGLSKWKDLLILAGVTYRGCEQRQSQLHIRDATSPYLEKLERLTEERRRLNEEMIELFEKHPVRQY